MVNPLLGKHQQILFHQISRTFGLLTLNTLSHAPKTTPKGHLTTVCSVRFL